MQSQLKTKQTGSICSYESLIVKDGLPGPRFYPFTKQL